MRILCIVIFLCFFGSKEACSSIRIDIEPGLGGFYRTQQWLPLKVILHNDDQNIQGTLSTVLSGMKYEIPIDLPANSQKRVFFYLYPNNPVREIKVSLHSGKSRILEDVAKIEELDQSVIFIGILRGSNPMQSYPFLEESEHPTRVINFTPEDLPDEWQGYDMFDIIIVDNLNPELLSSTQKKAFKHWLSSGGKLLLYGHYPLSLDGGFYEDLLPVSVFKMNTQDFGDKNSSSTEPSELLLNTNTLKKNCKIIQYFNGTPAIVKSEYGMGEVIYSTIPYYSPMLSGLIKDDSIRKELFAQNNRPFQINKLDISQTLSNNISTTDDKLLLSWEYIFYFSIIYCGSLVALYFTVFRRKNSYALNIIILVFFPIFFSALFGSMLFLFRSHNVKIDNFSLLIGSDQFKERILSSTFCILSAQKHKKLELGLRNPSFVIESADPVRDMNSANPSILRQTEYPALSNIRLNPLGNRSFYFRGILDSDAFIDANLSWHENSISGTISNTSQCNFYHSVIVAGDSYYELPDLEAQETIELNCDKHKGVIKDKQLSKEEKQFYNLIKSSLFQSVIKDRYPVLLGWFKEPILSYSLNEKYVINTHSSLFVYFL